MLEIVYALIAGGLGSLVPVRSLEDRRASLAASAGGALAAFAAAIALPHHALGLALFLGICCVHHPRAPSVAAWAAVPLAAVLLAIDPALGVPGALWGAWRAPPWRAPAQAAAAALLVVVLDVDPTRRILAALAVATGAVMAVGALGPVGTPPSRAAARRFLALGPAVGLLVLLLVERARAPSPTAVWDALLFASIAAALGTLALVPPIGLRVLVSAESAARRPSLGGLAAAGATALLLAEGALLAAIPALAFGAAIGLARILPPPRRPPAAGGRGTGAGDVDAETPEWRPTRT